MREAAGLGRGVKNLQLVPVHAHRRFHVGAFIRPAVIRPRLPARPRPAPPGIARLRVQPCSLAQQGSPPGDRHRAPHEPAYSELFISHLLARKIRKVEEDLVDQLFNSSEKRLARILLLLANLAPFHSITSLEACTTLSRPEPEYDARYSYNTLQNTICRKNKE